MAIPTRPEAERVNKVLSAGSAQCDPKAPPLDDFNNAYEDIRQVHERLANMIRTVKGEDSPIQEQPSAPHCLESLFNNMPDSIRNECHGLNDQITELEQILFT